MTDYEACTWCQCSVGSHSQEGITSCQLQRAWADLAALRAEVENAEEASKLASRIVVETIARAERAETLIEYLRGALRRIHEPHRTTGSPQFEVERLRCLASAGLTMIQANDRTALAAGERE
jgi:predicted RecB family endonuclease